MSEEKRARLIERTYRPATQVYRNGLPCTVSDEGSGLAIVQNREGTWACSWKEVKRASSHPTGNLTPGLLRRVA